MLLRRFVAVAVLIDALEILARRDDYGPRGLFHADLLRAQERWGGAGPLDWLMRGLMATDIYLTIVAATGVAAVVMLVAPAGWIATIGVLVALGGRLVVNLRTEFGMDGSDQMIVIVLSALAIAGLAGRTEGVAAACVVFVAIQVVLAYTTAGVAKLVSPVWRSGAALPAILRTASFGTESAGIWLGQHPAIARNLCVAVLAVECVLPFAVLAGVPGAWAFIAGGLAFHVGIALLMGLNSFLWSFLATFPSVLYAASLLESTPRALGGHIGLAAAVAVSLLAFMGLLGRALAPTAATSLDELRGDGPEDPSGRLTVIGTSREEVEAAEA